MLPLLDGWEFALGKPENFVPVTLPHDWLIADTNNLYRSDIGYYRRILQADATGLITYLRFDGVYMDTTVYVNGHTAMEWKYGCTAFEVNLTPWLKQGEDNEILVKVNYQSPSARWYTGAGILRDVWLCVKNPCHFAADGLYVTTKQQAGQWRYALNAEVETGGRAYEVRHRLMDAQEPLQAWDIDNPVLYTLRCELLVDGTVVDTEDVRIGFRSMRFTTQQGFYLNERLLKLKGVCLHDDLGALGGAIHKEALRRRLVTMKAMGVNAIRTAHNPPAKALMELTDEMGLLVMSEYADIWRRPKNTYDYARFFDEWSQRDVAAWVRRDRNHPSLMMWSIGNEIQDTHLDAADGAATMRRLMDLVHQHDPAGNAATTFCSNYLPWINTQTCADIIKLVGYNYGEKYYDAHHAAHPDWIIYGGETCSTVQSRGVYHFPLNKSVLADDDLQCSALGNSTTSWGAKNVETCILHDLQTPYSLGQFIWAGQDYIGEPTPYHTKSSYLGHVDTAGFPKDSYYQFKAGWTDWRKEVVLHIYPYWDFSPGQLIDVRVCTNAPNVELLKDGISLGRRSLDGQLMADWRIAYKPGALTVIAYDDAGNVIAKAERCSFEDAHQLCVTDDVYGDLHFYTITAVDKRGNEVQNANRRVYVKVKNGELLGMDNGDATDYDQYRADNRRMFAGKLLAIVKADPNKAPQFNAHFCTEDIPVRKIELLAEGYLVTARLLPENATYNDISWLVTDAGGIDSPIAGLSVAPDGRSATLLPKGDGEAYIRCCVNNGKPHVALISAMQFDIRGYGQPFLNPYALVSGGLYNRSNVELTNGNERGVATLRDGESHVGFAQLDFGDYGSDEITMPLFPLDHNPFTFELWEGMPLEGGAKVCDLQYDKGSIWNTYQEVTYKLPRRIKGITTLCMVFRQKVHIKGFWFTRLQKGLQRLPAAESDTVYGDSFSMQGDAIENIGNNVTLVYRDMDFGDEGIGSVELCWRSALERNAIQLVFAGEEGETRQMVDVTRAEAYTSQTFDLGATLRGMQTVSLVFLPGCQLDLQWLQFKR